MSVTGCVGLPAIRSDHSLAILWAFTIVFTTSGALATKGTTDGAAEKVRRSQIADVQNMALKLFGVMHQYSNLSACSETFSPSADSTAFVAASECVIEHIPHIRETIIWMSW